MDVYSADLGCFWLFCEKYFDAGRYCCMATVTLDRGNISQERRGRYIAMFETRYSNESNPSEFN